MALFCFLDDNPVDFRAIGQIAAGRERVALDFERAVIVRFRLGGDDLIEGVVLPKAGITDIARYTCEDVERALVVMPAAFPSLL